MQRLDYTAVTSGGSAFDIRFPLHQETGSADAVAEMLTNVLAGLSERLEAHQGTSDGDVLQALAMAMAIRARMVDVAPGVSLRLMHELIDQAFAATLDAPGYTAARA